MNRDLKKDWYSQFGLKDYKAGDKVQGECGCIGTMTIGPDPGFNKDFYTGNGIIWDKEINKSCKEDHGKLKKL